MNRMKDLKCKEVINVNDGYRYGYVDDVIVDTCTSKVKYIVVPAEYKLFGFFAPESEYVISWDNIIKIGDDIILVDICAKDCKHSCKWH